MKGKIMCKKDVVMEDGEVIFAKGEECKTMLVMSDKRLMVYAQNGLKTWHRVLFIDMNADDVDFLKKHFDVE